MERRTDLTKAQLFLDDTWIEETSFVSRQWHQPKKFPDPVLKPEHPWERWCPVMYGTVLHWRGKFRMWYNCWTRDPKPRVCYAESADGVAWEKPVLGVCEFDGSSKNNIALEGTTPERFIDDISIVDDPDDAEWPLKALFWEGTRHDVKQPDWGIWAARSKDGVHWDRSLGLVLAHWGDRFNAASVRLNGKYVVLGRAPGSRPHGRQAWRTESADLIHWSEPKRALARDLEDPVNMEYYSATAFPYESLTLGTIERMYMSPDRLDTELVWSYDDGCTWQRARTRPAFLAPSPHRAWDDTWVNLPTNGPIQHRGRLWFYYSGRSGAHGVPYPFNHGGIGLALLRVDGFASIHAAERQGWLVTRPMSWADADLFVNVDPRRDLSSHPGFCSGEVRVEVRAEANHALPGFAWDDCEPLRHNTASEPDSSARVVWRENKSLREMAGRRVRLAFRLRDAHLYSFRARAS